VWNKFSVTSKWKQIHFSRETNSQVWLVHICNPSYKGGRDRRIMVEGQPGQKVSKVLYQKKSQVWWTMSVVAEVERSGKNRDPI
jgi:hypothetical protein